MKPLKIQVSADYRHVETQSAGPLPPSIVGQRTGPNKYRFLLNAAKLSRWKNYVNVLKQITICCFP